MIGMSAFVIIGVLASLAADLGMSDAEAGLTMSVYAIAYAVSSPIIVSLTGRYRRRDVMVAGLLLCAAASAFSALAEGAISLFVARALAAVGAGIVTPVAAATIAAIVRPEERGQALAAVFFGFTLAQAVGVPAGAWFGFVYGWRFDFWAIAVVALIVAAAVLRFVPANVEAGAARLSELWALLCNWRAMAAISLTSFFIGSYFVCFTFIAPALEAGMGMGRDGISVFLLVTGLGGMLGNLAIGRLADRAGPSRALTICCVFALVFSPFFSFFPMPVWALHAIGFVWSVFGWGFFAAQQMRLVSLTGVNASVVLALNAAGIYLGNSIGSALGSAVVASYGLSALGWASAIGIFLALLNLLAVDRALARHAAAG